MTPKEEVLAIIRKWCADCDDGDDAEKLALAVARYAERRALERADEASAEHTCGCAYAIRDLPSEYDL